MVETAGPIAEVVLAEQRQTIAEGKSVSVGRRSSSDLQVGNPAYGPEDLGVSRQAATISHAQGHIWVRNDSATQPVYARAIPGPDYVLDRRGDMVALVGPHVEVVLEGRVRRYVVVVDRHPGEAGLEADDPITLSPATQWSLPLADTERRYLTAICAPLLLGAGAKPGSYRDAGELLGVTAHVVRNQLDATRERLALLGIPGMLGSEAKDALARYAVRSGTVTAADLEHYGWLGQRTNRT